jgi:hypothetical protein
MRIDLIGSAISVVSCLLADLIRFVGPINKTPPVEDRRRKFQGRARGSARRLSSQ